MAQPLGSHADRLSRVRLLRTVKGRHSERRFAFEGPTLLSEAADAGFPIEEIYATPAAYDASPEVRKLDEAGIPAYLVDAAALARISDVATPSGIVAVAPVRLAGIEGLTAAPGPLLVLAGVADPANAGTLLRSAEAFGCSRAVFGDLGIDPYHPKVVRGSMGAHFRLSLGVADADELAVAAQRAGMRLIGLAADGSPLESERWEPPYALVVGNERHGLGAWRASCESVVAIAMHGQSESLSAGVAGSIALYESSRATARGKPCQESTPPIKSQDYRP